MCGSCFDEYEITDSPAIQVAAGTIRELYRHSAVGGRLHIVTDDVGVEDAHVEFCAKEIANADGPGDPWADSSTPEQLAAERACLAALQPLTPDERASAIKASGLWA